MGDNIELPPEPGTVPDTTLGVPGPVEDMPEGDGADTTEDLDHDSYDDTDDDEPDELDGETDPNEREDGLEEPEDDA